jgi:hypothetical protein
MHEVMRNAYNILVGKAEGTRTLEKADKDETIILKRILEKYVVE